jgi:hypothetical protein
MASIGAATAADFDDYPPPPPMSTGHRLRPMPIGLPEIRPALSFMRQVQHPRPHVFRAFSGEFTPMEMANVGRGSEKGVSE